MKTGEASRNQSGKLYNLSDAEKIRLGLKKPAAPKGTIHVVIPMHYGAKGGLVGEPVCDGSRARRICTSVPEHADP